jgi:hypothetical protein
VIELAAPWALALAPLAAAPLAMHLMRRRRPREVAWGAMRFLAVAAAEQRRRLSVQERLLLAMRIAVLAAAALAAAQPAWVERGGDPVFVRSGRVACVIAIDDSAGTAAGGGDTAVRALAQAWLGTLEPGDEVSVLPLSRLADPAADPLLDLAAAGTLIQSLRPTTRPCSSPVWNACATTAIRTPNWSWSPAAAAPAGVLATRAGPSWAGACWGRPPDRVNARSSLCSSR